MPLTDFQQQLLADLGPALSDDSGYLAGGAALHFTPDSTRCSSDLDFFHDSVERVASAVNRDRARLEELGYSVEIGISQPGFVRAVVSRGDASTRVDWAHDSAWRFMPLVRAPHGGWLLHPIDLAINKVLALVGRDEPRDFVDVLYVHDRIPSLGALCWAAVGKDPGFTPNSLLELLKRTGRYRPEDFERLDMSVPFDLPKAREQWRSAIDAAEEFIRGQPAEEIGCLYWSASEERFVTPLAGGTTPTDVVIHFGKPGGVLPRVLRE